MNRYLLGGFLDELEKIAALPSIGVNRELLERVGAKAAKRGWSPERWAKSEQRLTSAVDQRARHLHLRDTLKNKAEAARQSAGTAAGSRYGDTRVARPATPGHDSTGVLPHPGQTAGHAAPPAAPPAAPQAGPRQYHPLTQALAGGAAMGVAGGATNAMMGHRQQRQQPAMY